MLKRILSSLDVMIDNLTTNHDRTDVEFSESIEHTKNAYAVTHTGNRHGEYYIVVVDGDNRVPLDCEEEVYRKIERLSRYNPGKFPVIKARIDSANLIVNKVYSYSLIDKDKVKKTPKEEQDDKLEELQRRIARDARALSSRRDDII